MGLFTAASTGALVVGTSVVVRVVLVVVVRVVLVVVVCVFPGGVGVSDDELTAPVTSMAASSVPTPILIGVGAERMSHITPATTRPNSSARIPGDF
ncbi:MAG: hypothetical protein LBH11_03935 [Propionibacteriaceae bacterium]|nr:hypothetical protein [Propionibacteriaceae bacterium]